MAAMVLATIALLLAFNLLFFTMVSSTSCPCPSAPSKSPPKPQPKPHPKPPPKATCPRDALKLGACANVLKGLINVGLGKPSKTTCCPLIAGLVDLEAAVCLCTALKAKVLGINLNVPISLRLLLQFCGKNVPKGFKCA